MATATAVTKIANGAVQQHGFGMTPEQVDVIRNTVAKGANDNELAMFLHLANRYDLDPFAKEIWFIKYDGTPTLFTSRDGYLKIANNHPQMDGIVSDVVRKGDTFERTPDNVKHAYGESRGAIVGAYCLVYRKDRGRPVYVFAPFEEYNTGKTTWKNYPSAMIQKVAEAMALKRAFSISGLVTREELDTDDAPPRNITPQKAEPPKQARQAAADDATPLPQTLDELMSYAHNLGLSEADVKEALFVATGRETLKGVKLKDSELRAWLNEIDERGAQLVDIDAEQGDSGPDDISDLTEPQAVAQ